MAVHDKKSRSARVRTVVQSSVFVLVFMITISKWLADKGFRIPFLPNASLHAVCPFGGVVSVYEFAVSGNFVQKIHNSSFILMILGLIVAALFGTVFCGYICPFGTFQEWIGRLGRRLFPKTYNHVVPERADRILRYLRYGVLAVVIYRTAVTAKLVFQSVDPYYALFNFFTGEVAVTAFMALGAIAVISLLVERPWCKYFCPYGALLGLFNPIRIFALRRSPKACTGCARCDKVCPMNIKVSKKKMIRDPQCISCHKCVSGAACPAKDALIISAGKAGGRVEN